MNTEKVIVVLLLIAILLSVITLTITISANVMVTTNQGMQEDMATASVILDIVRNPAVTGGAS